MGSGTFRAHDLSVVVPTRQRPELLRRTLAALEVQSERGFEVLVVLDGEDQAAVELDGVRVLRQPHAGPGAARNHGVASSDRRLILFLGDDMIPHPDLIARHLDHHRHCPTDEVAVLGRVSWHSAVPRDSLHRWLNWSGALFDFPPDLDQADPDAGWERFYSCNVSLKRSFFRQAGGFDPAFVFDYEDLDLGWRLGQLGLRLLYEPQARADHLHRYDWEAVVRRYESRAGAERLMAQKHSWFEPWFFRQMLAAQDQPRASKLWSVIVDLVPSGAPRLRAKFERRADRYYRQRLAEPFMTAWRAAAAGHEPAAGGDWPQSEMPD